MRLLAGMFLMFTMGGAMAFPWLADGENIRGAKYLSPDERKAHVARMLNFKTHADCRAYLDAHNQLVDERAAAQGEKVAPMQGDPCAVMRTMGRVK